MNVSENIQYIMKKFQEHIYMMRSIPDLLVLSEKFAKELEETKYYGMSELELVKAIRDGSNTPIFKHVFVANMDLKCVMGKMGEKNSDIDEMR